MELYVNGEIIENTLIEAEINRLRPSYQRVFENQTKEEQEKQLAEWARENMIEAVLFRQQARKTFPEIASQDIQNVLRQLLVRENENGTLHQRLQAGSRQQQKVYEEIADQIRHEKLHTQIAGNVHRPSEKEIRKYYDQHLADCFTIPEMVHAAHIVKYFNADESKEEQYQQMGRIKDKLDQGIPFEELAKANSDCSENAGDLGFFARGKMVPAFEEVVFRLEAGSYSEVFETEFGWHIVRVIEKRPSIPCELDQVREVIVRDLTQQAAQKAVEQFLDAQKEKADIEER